MDKGKWLLLFLLAMVSLIVITFFGVYLWNYVVVVLFGLPEINFWQMLALMILVRIFISPIHVDKN